MAAYIIPSAVYDDAKSELSFIINHSTGKFFRMVYNSTRVMALINGTDTTFTSAIYTIEEFKTEQEVLDRIEAVGLEYEPPEDPDKI